MFYNINNFLGKILSFESWKNSLYQSNIKIYHSNDNNIKTQPTKHKQFLKKSSVTLIPIYQKLIVSKLFVQNIHQIIWF